jgi:hypothetical protein
MLLSKTTKRILGDCFTKRQARYHSPAAVPERCANNNQDNDDKRTTSEEVLSSTSISNSDSSSFTSSDDRYFVSIVQKVMEQTDDDEDDSYCSCSSKPRDEPDEEKTFGSYDIHELLLHTMNNDRKQEEEMGRQGLNHDNNNHSNRELCSHANEEFHDTTKAILVEKLPFEQKHNPFVEMITMIDDLMQPLATNDSDADQDERKGCKDCQQSYPQISTSLHQSKLSNIPTWIEFEVECETKNNDNTYNSTLGSMIWDATTPLRYHNLDPASIAVMDDADFFMSIADEFHALLGKHLDKPQSARTQNELLFLMKTCPLVCQLRLPSTDGDFYFPLTYFCITSAHTLVQACYQAFPEAIGMVTNAAANNNLGVLGDAIQHEADPEIIEFLIRRFPDAVKRTDENQQTPLHWACELQSDFRIVQLLLDVFPAAAQLVDCNGNSPLHIFLQNLPRIENGVKENSIHRRNAESILLSLLSTSPLTISTVTANLEKPLHVAVQNDACDLSIIKLLHRADPSAIAFTDGMFRLPIHWSVVALARKQQKESIGSDTEHNYSMIKFLVQELPESVDLTDENGETPLDIANRLWSCRPPLRLVQLLTNTKLILK